MFKMSVYPMTITKKNEGRDSRETVDHGSAGMSISEVDFWCIRLSRILAVIFVWFWGSVLVFLAHFS